VFFCFEKGNAWRFFFGGLSVNEMSWLYVVAVVTGKRVPLPRLLDQFHHVVVERNGSKTDRAKSGIALALEACEGRSKLVLLLDESMISSKSVARTIVKVSRQAAAAGVEAGKGWLLVKLFYSDSAAEGWNNRAGIKFLTCSSAIVGVLLALLWCLKKGALRQWKSGVVVVALAIVIWLTICVLLGRQNVFPVFRYGSVNPYRKGQNYALLLNSEKDDVVHLIANLRNSACDLDQCFEQVYCLFVFIVVFFFVFCEVG
jgi:hypothetical protein